MDDTLQLSMTEIEMQFDSMDDLDVDLGMDPTAVDLLLEDTEVLDMKFREQSAAAVDEAEQAELRKRARGLPDHFGPDDDPLPED